MKQVYVVTVVKSLEVEPIVTVFSNREAAMKCFKYYISLDYKCCIDACDIYDHFVSYEREVSDEKKKRSCKAPSKEACKEAFKRPL